MIPEPWTRCGRSQTAILCCSFSRQLLEVTAVAAILAAACNRSQTTMPTPPEPVSATTNTSSPGKDNSPTPATDIQLVDVSAEAGVNFTYRSGTESNECTILESLGGGIGCLDFDRDGHFDLFLPGGGQISPGKLTSLPASLWRNVGTWKYRNVAEHAGATADRVYTHGTACSDIDNDGFVDVLVTGYGGLQLLHNQGDGTFLRRETEAGLSDALWSTSAGFADLNADGAVDFYVCHYVDWSFDNNPFCRGPNEGQRDICPPKRFSPLPHIVYYSNGDGTFRDASEFAGLRQDGKGLGTVLCDLDRDNDVDIYVANDTTENFFYRNDGSGRFEEVGVLHGVALDQFGGPNGSMGVSVGDYNQDGLPDVWVANYEQEAFALYHNSGDGFFLHMSEMTGVTALGGLFVGFGTLFLDVELDGDEDLVVTNGHVIKFPTSGRIPEQPILLLNNRNRYGRERFPADSFFGREHKGRGLIVADLDQDDDLDIAISHNDEPAALLRNDTAKKGRSMQLRLIGHHSNRDAIGAHLELVTDKGIQHRWICGGGSYLSQSPYEVTWGVPPDETVQEVRITWPAGTQQVLKKLSLDELHLVHELDTNEPITEVAARGT